MAKITLFYGFIYLCRVNNRNHQWQQQLFLQKRTRWEPLFLIISTITELIVCGYSLPNSKKMKFPSKNCSVVYSLCLY